MNGGMRKTKVYLKVSLTMGLLESSKNGLFCQNEKGIHLAKLVIYNEVCVYMKLKGLFSFILYCL